MVIHNSQNLLNIDYIPGTWQAVYTDIFSYHSDCIGSIQDYNSGSDSPLLSICINLAYMVKLLFFETRLHYVVLCWPRIYGDQAGLKLEIIFLPLLLSAGIKCVYFISNLLVMEKRMWWIY